MRIPVADFASPAERPAGQRLRVLPGRLERATNAYQRDLVSIYDRWSTRAMRAVFNAQRDGLPPSQQAAILSAMLGDLEDDLIQAGRLRITDAVFASMRGPLESWRGSGPMLAGLQRNLAQNENFIRTGLMPDIGQRIQLDILDGVAQDRQALRGAFERLRYRPAQYAGGLHQAVMSVSIEVGRADDQRRREIGAPPTRIKWELDPTAEHCEDDPVRGTFGCERLAGEYVGGWNALPGAPGEVTTCRGNDRCVLSIFVPEINDWHRVG
jgi:hypothetical protein